MAKTGGYLALDDLTALSHRSTREPLRGTYRGFEIVGPPPPSSGPLHIIQMLNILEGYDIGALGFATAGHAASAGRGAEDRLRRPRRGDRRSGLRAGAGGEAAVEVLRRRAARAHRSLARAQAWSAEVAPGEGAHTTHLTVADGMGNVVASTQTINSLFGARYIVPGTGMIPNNYMFVFDPRPGRASSVQPGKRVTSSMSPVIVLRDGKPALCAGAARRAAHLPVGDAGAVEPDRPRHERAGGGGGAARSGRRATALEVEASVPGERAAGAARPRATTWRRWATSPAA